MTRTVTMEHVSRCDITGEMFVEMNGEQHSILRMNVTVAVTRIETPEQTAMLAAAWDWIENREIGRTDSLWGMKVRQGNGFIMTKQMARKMFAEMEANAAQVVTAAIAKASK